MSLTPSQYKQMKKFLESDQRNKKTALLQDDLEPGPLKDEMKGNFDPTQETYEEYLRRINLADGGMLVKPGFGGVRQGYSGEYGPNIRKATKTDSFEVQGVRGGKGGGKGGQKFYKTFNFDKYGGEKKALKAAKEYRDSFLNIKKDIGKFSKGRPVGFKSTTGGQAEIRKALNDIIKAGGKSFSNEDIRKLVDMDLFPDDDQFRKAVDVVKKEPAFKNLTFVDARSLKSKADYYTDPSIRKKIKKNYKKLKQENLAKLVFPDEPLTTSKSRLDIILSDMADKGEIERLAVGKASEERIGEFDPSPESEKKAKIGRRRRKKIDILGAKDYEKELFDFKKEVQAGLGLEKVKKGKFDPIDMGHQSSIKQLKALKQKLRPEDLSPQFYKANQLGIQKYEGGVKTLENSLDRKFYPEQKKLYKQAKKFVDAGQEIPADLQNKIIKLNERIQIFIDDTVKKYPLLRDRVNAVTINPINLDVKRGGNVFKQLGIGIVDQDLGKIKTGSLDDLTIKANLAEQTLREAIDAGLIDKNIGRQRLDKFLNVRPIENSETKQIIATLSKDPRCQIRGFKNQGGRVGFQDGSASLDVCFRGGIDNINRGLPNPTAAQARNFGRVAALGRNVVKFGILPEALFLAGESVIRMGMGDTLPEAILKASEYLLPGNQTKIADRMMLARTVGPKTAELILKANDLRGFENQIENLENEKQFTGILTDDGFDDNFFGQTKVEEENAIQKQIDALKKRKESYGSLTESQFQFADMQAQEAEDIKTSRALFPKLLAKARSVDIASDDPLAEAVKENINLDLKMLPSRFQRLENLEARKPKFDILVNTPKQQLSNFFKGQELENILEDKKLIEGYRKETVSEAAALNPEAMFSASTGLFAPPIDLGVSYTPPPIDTITEMEREITGQTNLNERGEVINPFDIDRSSFATGLRGFAAAGGGIAKLAGVDSGPPPASGPNSQGLQGLMKRVKRI